MNQTGFRGGTRPGRSIERSIASAGIWVGTNLDFAGLAEHPTRPTAVADYVHRGRWGLPRSESISRPFFPSTDGRIWVGNGRRACRTDCDTTRRSRQPISEVHRKEGLERRHLIDVRPEDTLGRIWAWNERNGGANALAKGRLCYVFRRNDGSARAHRSLALIGKSRSRFALLPSAGAALLSSFHWFDGSTYAGFPLQISQRDLNGSCGGCYQTVLQE
jgi:hypothetical protein